MPRQRGIPIAPAEREEYISSIVDWLIAGASRGAICKQAESKNWDVSKRTIDVLITKAKKQIEDEVKDSKAYHLTIATRRLNSLYAAATNIKDYKTALQVQKTINDLFGLNEKQTLNISIDDGAVRSAVRELSLDEARAKLKAIQTELSEA
ncbi:hypothetical protein FACS1894184_14790 [Clostridia bacterium]|nr:hypothetical protein FACS1894184_14790 [Clostridia bacterium]